MILSPFNPIFFIPHKSYGRECPYMQVFATSDRVVFQAVRAEAEQAAEAVLVNALTGEEIPIEAVPRPFGGGETVDVYTLPETTDGCYFVALGESESESFRITSDMSELEGTLAVDYSPATNRLRRDVAGVIDGSDFYFRFRIPGGFKDSGWEFSIDNEQFSTPLSDIVELYGRESTQTTLTLGQNVGVPVWFGDLLNRLLTCRYVYIDGLRYARFGSSVPEKTQTLEGVNGFVFTQKLQRVNHIDPIRKEALS